MRRVGNLWPQIVCFENLLRATRNAARGKRQVRSVARFLERAEYEVLSIERDLVSKTYTPGRPTSFKIRDPKERTITVVPFRDRVVHHALIDPLESIFDRRMIPESFACRRGKGNHAALRYAQGLLRQYRYFLKLDIERYFETLSHKVVMETLQRLVKDKNVLWLCDRIVRAQGFRGRGLPIGNLTSQWFANLVLDRVDRYAKEVLRVPGYVRYMDDFVLFAEKRERLKESLGDLRDFLDSSLGLKLKDRATILAPFSEGLPFLGWRIYRRQLRLRPANLRRTRRRLRHRFWEYRSGRLGERGFIDSLRSVVSHLGSGNTVQLRREWLDGHGNPGRIFIEGL